MDLFEEELIRFLDLLGKEKVRYILVGGLAVNYHGFSRTTADVDLWVDDSIENREKLVKALLEYGVTGAEVYSDLPLIAGYSEILLDNGMHIDLMNALQFFDQARFTECYDRAIVFDLEGVTGVRIIHLNALLEEKEKSSRLKDKLDAEELKKLNGLK